MTAAAIDLRPTIMFAEIERLSTQPYFWTAIAPPANIAAMQASCDAHGVELWPHIKTHKMIEVAKMQLAAGAKGWSAPK